MGLIRLEVRAREWSHSFPVPRFSCESTWRARLKNSPPRAGGAPEVLRWEQHCEKLVREHVSVRDRTYEQHAQGIHRQLAAQEAEVRAADDPGRCQSVFERFF